MQSYSVLCTIAGLSNGSEGLPRLYSPTAGSKVAGLQVPVRLGPGRVTAVGNIDRIWFVKVRIESYPNHL